MRVETRDKAEEERCTDCILRTRSRQHQNQVSAGAGAGKTGGLCLGDPPGTCRCGEGERGQELGLPLNISSSRR